MPSRRAKFDQFPFWPALVSDLSARDIDKATRKELSREERGKQGAQSKERVLVKFFESGEYSWIPRNKVCNYRPGSTAPDGGRKINNDPEFQEAVLEAQQYLDSVEGEGF